MTSIYDEVQKEVYDVSSLPHPVADAEPPPPVDPPDEKTYGGGDESEEPTPNVVLDYDRIYAGLAEMCGDSSVQFDVFGMVPKDTVVAAFVRGYNNYVPAPEEQ